MQMASAPAASAATEPCSIPTVEAMAAMSMPSVMTAPRNPSSARSRSPRMRGLRVAGRES